MSDRELLELAARAAGIGPLDFDYAKRESHGIYFGPRLPMPQGVLMAAMHEYWNPLTDDGDALRLAVKLKLPLQFPDWMDMARTWSAKDDSTPYDELAIGHNGDLLAAARRAITRAAAEIGKGMP